MTPPTPNSHLAESLSVLLQGDRSSWRHIATLLLRIKQEANWPFQDAASFEKWLSGFSREVGLGKTMLHTYVWVAQYYQTDLRPKLSSWGLDAPDLMALPASVGPETLNYMRKLSSAGITDVERHYGALLVTGGVKRDELRRAWHACRATIKSEPTKRGRIRYDDIKARSARRSQQFEADVTNAIIRDKGIVTATGTLLPCSVAAIKPGLFVEEAMPDIIMIMQNVDGTSEIHAVQVAVSLECKPWERGRALLPYYDRVWLAVPADDAQIKHLASVDERIGILIVLNSSVTVIRDPQKTTGDPDTIMQTLRRLVGLLR